MCKMKISSKSDLSKINRLLYILLSIVIFISCETDIDANIYMEPEPVVYSIINPFGNIHYVKLNKTYHGGQDALISAKIPDSIYFNKPTVKLEIRTPMGMVVYRRKMEMVDNVPKETGIFASNRNELYVLKEIKFILLLIFQVEKKLLPQVH